MKTQPKEKKTSKGALPGFQEGMKHYLKRVKIPGFDETDPLGWIGKAEQYYTLHDTPLENRLKIAHMCMEDTTLHWYR